MFEYCGVKCVSDSTKDLEGMPSEVVEIKDTRGFDMRLSDMEIITAFAYIIESIKDDKAIDWNGFSNPYSLTRANLDFIKDLYNAVETAISEGKSRDDIDGVFYDYLPLFTMTVQQRVALVEEMITIMQSKGEQVQ